MPHLLKNRERKGGYLLAAIRGASVGTQLSLAGEHRLTPDQVKIGQEAIA